MRLLYVYMKFCDYKERPYRGFHYFEVNLGREHFIYYKNKKLYVSKADLILPEAFWGENIYNITTLAGDNGSGKSTIMNCIMASLQQIYNGRITDFNKSILVMESAGHISVLHMPGKTTDKLEIIGQVSALYTLHPFEPVSSRWIDNTIKKTKMIYITNTINEEDYRRGRLGYGEGQWNIKRYTHVRNQFLYDCSTCGLMLSDYRNEIDRKRYQGANEEGWLSVFFAYEQYKQVKYVFDKRQYAILKHLKDQGYQVPVPRQLLINMEPADFNQLFSSEHQLVGFRGKSREKTMMFPKAAKRMEIWEKKIKDNEDVDESAFFTEVLLYGFGCNCVLSLLRSIVLYLPENKSNFVNQIAQMLTRYEQEDIDAKLAENEFLTAINDIMDIYENISKNRNDYLHQVEKCYGEFIKYIFGEKDMLLKHFQIKASIQDYLESDLLVFPFSVVIDDAEWFCEFLQKYRYICNPYYFLNFSWGLSSGENNLLRLFTSFYYIFERDYANKINGEYKIYNFDKTGHRITCDSIILIMDEADLTYHPDWQRRFISVLTAFLQEIYPPKCCKEIQILLSTHSPLLLGDMPQHNVIYLKTNEKVGLTEVDNSGRLETFGQNIHLILRDSFFLRKGTIGEFAGKKIQGIAEELNSIRLFLEKIESESLTVDEKYIKRCINKIENELCPIISILADGIIKGKLMEMSIEYTQQLERLLKSASPYANMSSELLLKEMQKIEEELKKRKKR